MKLIDEKGRIRGKVSVIDLAILLLVIIIAIGAFLKFMVLDQTAVTVQEAPVRYTLEIANVRHWAMHNIREGDTVFASGGVAIGTIVSVEAEPFRSVPVGRSWWGVVPERYLVLVEVSATATVTDGRFLVSRTVPMGEGNSTAPFTTRYAEFSAMVREIGLYDGA